MVGWQQIYIDCGLTLFFCLCVCHVYVTFFYIPRHTDISEVEEGIDPKYWKCQKCQNDKSKKKAKKAKKSNSQKSKKLKVKKVKKFKNNPDYK